MASTECLIQTIGNILGDRVGILFQTLWDASLGLVLNCFLLSKKAEELEREAENLKDLARHFGNRAPVEALRGERLSGWMKRAKKRTEDADAFRTRYEDRAFCICGLCLGCDVVELLRRVRELNNQGEDLSNLPIEFIYAAPTSSFKLVSSDASSSSIVGAEERLQKIKDHVVDENIRVIGIYGMAGVGKTALLKIIHNEYIASTVMFDVVIWVEVSESREDTILGTIAARLGLPSDTSRDNLLNFLSRCRLALFLDDVWADLNLVRDIREIVKILFTTRSEKIVDKLGSDARVKVEPLDLRESWQFFESKIDPDILNNSEIRPHAEDVVARCGGLPIYLIVVGREMAGAKTADEWQHAAFVLDHFAMELCDDMKNVLQCLKRSYDRLNGARLRDCFLYCALFPRDYAIPEDQIIDYWICEGFLDLEEYVENDITRLRSKGSTKIQELKKASVVENADGNSVKLHDAVRNMIQWVARSDDHQFVVLAGDVSRFPKLYKWQSARRISFVGVRDMAKKLPASYWDCSCPELTTLLLRDNVHAKNVNRQGFFRNLPALKVLDLKGGALQQFPEEITSVTSLQYLNLSDIPSLPNIGYDELFQNMKLRIKRP